MLIVALFLGLAARAAADECHFKNDDHGDVSGYFFRRSQKTPKSPNLWAGFGCEMLHCDAATGALWVREHNKQLGQIFRMKNSRGHERVDRSFCMATKRRGECSLSSTRRARLGGRSR